CGDPAWGLGRTRQWGHVAERAGSARATVQPAPAADVLARSRFGAARRRVGRRHGGERRSARGRSLARRDTRATSVRSRRRPPGRIPRGRGDGFELPRDASSRGRIAARGGGSAARGTRPAHPRSRRRGLRAHRPHRAWGLGDGATAPRRDPRRATRARGALPRARGGDRPRRRPGSRGGPGVKVCRTIPDARAELEPVRGASIGLVPTMGALHDGHPSLLRAARAENETVVMSLFVNPAQFGEEGDLAGYPRDEERDLARAREVGVDLVFAPSADEMYPPGFETWVDVTQLGSVLEGRFRPGHFRGVATIVLKLLTIVRPNRAYFGQKDPQQAEVVRRLVRDLPFEVG